MDDAVLKFAQTMQVKLDKNKYKECSTMNPHSEGRKWNHCGFFWLLDRLREETMELEEALRQEPNRNYDAIMKEAADVGNFAMMIHDNAENLLKNRKEIK